MIDSVLENGRNLEINGRSIVGIILSAFPLAALQTAYPAPTRLFRQFMSQRKTTQTVDTKVVPRS